MKIQNSYKLNENAIGERITKIRNEKGLTQKELADRVGIKRALISDYERGKVRIYGDMVALIAVALRVSTDEIIGLKNNKGNKNPPSLRLMKRLYEIEKLNPSQQKALLKNIDMFLKAASQDKKTS